MRRHAALLVLVVVAACGPQLTGPVRNLDGHTSGGGPDREVTVTVDRPFIFLIRDAVSGEVLFAGRVVDPSLS
jgi:Serpin (serine protease inhibitor)